MAVVWFALKSTWQASPTGWRYATRVALFLAIATSLYLGVSLEDVPRKAIGLALFPFTLLAAVAINMGRIAFLTAPRFDLECEGVGCVARIPVSFDPSRGGWSTVQASAVGWYWIRGYAVGREGTSESKDCTVSLLRVAIWNAGTERFELFQKYDEALPLCWINSIYERGRTPSTEPINIRSKQKRYFNIVDIWEPDKEMRLADGHPTNLPRFYERTRYRFEIAVETEAAHQLMVVEVDWRERDGPPTTKLRTELLGP